MKINKFYSAITLILVSSSAFATFDWIRSDKDNECALYMCVPGGFISDSCVVPRQRFHERLMDIDFLTGTPKWTPLPRWDLCQSDGEDGSTEQLSNAYSKAGIPMPEDLKRSSDVGYVWRIDARIPEHQECTGWTTAYIYKRTEYATKQTAIRKCDKDNYPDDCDVSREIREINYCSSWRTVSQHFIEGVQCTFNHQAHTGKFEDLGYIIPSVDSFKYDDKAQRVGSYNSPEWCDKSVHTVGVTVDGALYGNYSRTE